MQWPLFHDLQWMIEEDDPGGLADSFEVVSKELIELKSQLRGN